MKAEKSEFEEQKNELYTMHKKHYAYKWEKAILHSNDEWVPCVTANI